MCKNMKIKNNESAKKAKLRIAKKAYEEVVRALIDVQEKLGIKCDLPCFIEVDGERFDKMDLMHFSVINDK